MAPLLRDHIAPKGSGEDPEGALSLARVCAEAAPAAMPVMPSTARAPAARSEAPAPFASGKTAPLLQDRIAPKGSGESPEGDLSPPGMRRSSPGGRAGLAIDGAPVRRQVGSARALCKQKKWPRFCGAVSRQREAERIWRAISFARVCAEAAPAAMPVMPSTARPSATRSGAPVPLASGKTAPLLRGRIASKGSGEDPEGALSLPRVCAEAALAAMPVMPSTARPSAARSGAPVPLASRKNGPVFAGPYRVKGKRRGSGGRSPSPGCWTRPAPASRPGRRRSRPGGHPRRQSR